ncbi:MAG: DUF4279 domain-containing protein [Hyphomonas sp.]|nr:DUF4279 domain-containing protein [Hyphomonas sp.]
MAELNNSVASLRILGDDLDPEEITALLGKEPTVAERKGQEITSGTGAKRVAQSGRWSFHSDSRTPGDLDNQITELLNGTSDDLAVWNDLAVRFRIDIFCGLFLLEENEGFSLSPQTLLRIGERGIKLGFDIYAPETTDEPVP